MLHPALAAAVAEARRSAQAAEGLGLEAVSVAVSGSVQQCGKTQLLTEGEVRGRLLISSFDYLVQSPGCNAELSTLWGCPTAWAHGGQCKTSHKACTCPSKDIVRT